MIAQKIAHNIIFVGLSKILSIGIALYAISLLTRYLGVDAYGDYTVALAYLGFMMALGDMGLYSITTREISRDGADENEIVNKIFTLRILISAVIFVLSLVAIMLSTYEDQVKSAIFVIAGAFMFSSTYSLLNSVFQKHVEMHKVAIAELVGKAIQMGTIIMLVRLNLPFVFSVLAILFAMIANFALVMIFVRKHIKLRIEIDVNYWKKFIQKSLPLAVSAIATFLYFKVDTIILSFFHESYDVGIYGAAYKVIETMAFFPAMVIGLVLPLFSRFIFTDSKKFTTVSDTTIKFFMLLVIPIVTTLFFLSPVAIDLIGGQSYTASVGVLKILSIAVIGLFFNHLFMNIAIAADFQKKLMYILIAAATLNIVLNLILIPVYSYMGAAITTVVTELLVTISVAIMISRNTIFRFPIQNIAYYVISLGLIILINLFLPFSLLLNALLALIVYGVFIIATRVVTIKDLYTIRPSLKGDN